MANEGLAGIDFITAPYDTEADPALWTVIYQWAERAAEVGLGITVHAGEFSAANLGAALRVLLYADLVTPFMPPQMHSYWNRWYGVMSPWNAAYPAMLILGAAPSYTEHPIRQFVALGILSRSIPMTPFVFGRPSDVNTPSPLP